jgi:hypothetical protein
LNQLKNSFPGSGNRHSTSSDCHSSAVGGCTSAGCIGSDATLPWANWRIQTPVRERRDN